MIALELGAIIGLVLALTGAGGGILAIPLLVFGLHLPLQQAAPTGLLAVGLASAIGTGLALHQQIVRYRAAILIGSAGMLLAPVGVILAQWIPNRPLLSFFSIVLAYTSWRMLRSAPSLESHIVSRPCVIDPNQHRLIWTYPCARALAGIGIISGLLSGLLGVGGGFVIIPALKHYTNLDIRSIQATSLAVIALVSLSGVSTAAWHGSLPWKVALPFSAGAVLALLLGRLIANRLPIAHLQQAFAWFCLATALLLLTKACIGDLS